MNNIIQLMDKACRAAYVEWQYLIDEGSLQTFEAKAQSLPSASEVQS